MINLEEDAKAQLTVTEADLSQLAEYAELQLSLEGQIEAAEARLKELKDSHYKVSEQMIPEKMTACGMSEFKLTNGRKITVKKFYSASITDENRKAAFDWLNENDFMDIVKHNIAIPLARGEDEKCTAITESLTQMGVAYIDEQKIHPQTLKAFVKEQVESGSDLPLETFKVFIGNKAVIK